MEIRLAANLEELVKREADMDPVEQAALEVARDHAPYDPDSDGPHLRDSIRGEKLPGGGVRIVADSDHAAFVEGGTENMDAQPFLAVIPDALHLKR